MMTICGLNRTTLLDYPGHVAATVFMGGCNFRCPFCHNGGLVLAPESEPKIMQEELLEFLKKRKGILTGVCLSGGEPTLQTGLEELIMRIRDLDLLVKLDTNGYRPEVLMNLGEKGLLNYIAMDIKNSMQNYSIAIGMEQPDTGRIQESIQYIMQSGIPYEFRTTLVKELHTREDMLAIGEEIRGAELYYMQKYKDSEQMIRSGYHAVDQVEMEYFRNLLMSFVKHAELRGID